MTVDATPQGGLISQRQAAVRNSRGSRAVSTLSVLRRLPLGGRHLQHIGQEKLGAVRQRRWTRAEPVVLS